MWLRIFFAFYFRHQKYVTLCKTYDKHLQLCVCLISMSFIRWNWWGFHAVDWRVYLNADWPLELPEGVFLCTVTWVLEEILACKWSRSVCECSCCRAGVNSHWQQGCSHPCQVFQCWACWSTRMGSYGLAELSCSGMFLFPKLWESLDTLVLKWWSWLTWKCPVLSVHSICSSIQSTPVTALAETSRNSVVQEPQKVDKF